MNSNVAYGLLTLLQDRAASFLNGNAQSKMPKFTSPTPLATQLKDSTTDVPRTLLFDISELLDELHVFDMADGGGGRQNLGNALRARLQDIGRSLLEGQGLDALKRVLDDLHQLQAANQLSPVFAGLLARQVGIGISFVTTLRNLGNPDLVQRIPEGWLKYFFGEAGFDTVDGIVIAAPGHEQFSAVLSDPLKLADVKGLKALVNERSAQQYVRDLIRITIEVGADARYSLNGRDLRQRHQAMLDLVGKDGEAKARRWFKGAASLSESLVTSAVEEVALGVSEFQTNAVLAAAAATFAGTVARKATQHVFLAEVGV